MMKVLSATSTFAGKIGASGRVCVLAGHTEKRLPVHQRFFRQIFCLICLISCYAVLAEEQSTQTSRSVIQPPVQLSGEEILSAFSNVEDRADVHDAEGTQAVNHWYADGTFVNYWNDGKESGEIRGSWRVENNQRCTTLVSGLEKITGHDRQPGKERCGPIYRRGDEYITFNRDGSIHAIHSLSPLPEITQPESQ